MSPRRGVVLAHRWAGLLLGAVLVVVTLSGSAVVFAPELYRLVASGPAAGVRGADPDATAALLASAAPGAAVVALSLADRPGLPDAWLMRTREASWRVFTDPGDGTVLGSTGDSALAAAVEWLARFHHDLWLRPVGDVVVGASGLLLAVFCLSGIYLIWPQLCSWAAMRRMDAHRQVGLWSMPLLIVAGVTGAMFEFPWLRRGVHALLGGGAADVPPALRAESARPRSRPGDGPEISWTLAIATAAAAIPDGRVSRVMPPRRDDATGTWRVRLRVSGSDATVLLDRRLASVVEVQDPRLMSAGGWLLHEQLSIHTGAWGGLATRVLWLLAGLAPTALFLTGLAMWRRRQRRIGDPT